MDIATSPEMQVEPPPVEGPMMGLEKPSVLQLAEAKLNHGLNRNAAWSKAEVFMFIVGGKEMKTEMGSQLGAQRLS